MTESKSWAFTTNLVMKEKLGLVRGQVDIDRGRRHREAEHEDGITASGSVVRILSTVVLPQQLKRGKKRNTY